jgi:radical SAM superfamily enzyme YgiQ (UPF0313 family)
MKSLKDFMSLFFSTVFRGNRKLPNKRVLLLENKYKKKYRNLALMKFSTHYKRLGYEVEFYSGIDKKGILKEHYDIICFSTIFTFHFKEDIKTILFYKEKYPDAHIMVGGVSATLNPERFYKETGIKPIIGIYHEIENLPPDYELFPEHPMYDVSEVFTSRGCKNACGFCAVKTLEPEFTINPNWKDSIDLTKPKAMIHDNNLTTCNINHFKEVMDYIKKHKIKVIFDNGFDCRFFTFEHLECLKGVNFDRGGLRFAFDSMGQDGKIQETIMTCLSAGIPARKIMVFLLYNYIDSFEEAFYRANEIRKLGVRPYPQQYRPLDDLGYYNTHISLNWNKKLLKDFRMYWMWQGIHRKLSWEEYIKQGGAKGFEIAGARE